MSLDHLGFWSSRYQHRTLIHTAESTENMYDLTYGESEGRRIPGSCVHQAIGSFFRSIRSQGCFTPFNPAHAVGGRHHGLLGAPDSEITKTGQAKGAMSSRPHSGWLSFNSCLNRPLLAQWDLLPRVVRSVFLPRRKRLRAVSPLGVAPARGAINPSADYFHGTITLHLQTEDRRHLIHWIVIRVK